MPNKSKSKAKVSAAEVNATAAETRKNHCLNISVGVIGTTSIVRMIEVPVTLKGATFMVRSKVVFSAEAKLKPHEKIALCKAVQAKVASLPQVTASGAQAGIVEAAQATRELDAPVEVDIPA